MAREKGKSAQAGQRKNHDDLLASTVIPLY
jgi:hypothetical protein